MATITSSGIGSGLDINSLVTQLVAAEGDPARQRLDRKEAGLQAELSAFGTLKGALSGFRSSLTNLKTLGSEVMQATAANSELFSTVTTSVATPGSHSVEVTRLAQAQRLASKAFANVDDAVGGGKLVFRFGTYDSGANTFTVNPERSSEEVTVGAGATLEEVRDAINEAEIGVAASIVNDGSGYRLVLTSAETGEANGIELMVEDDDSDPLDDAGLSQLAYDPTAAGLGSGKNLSQTEAAEDALLKVDGLDITRSGNSVTGVIEGVTLNLQAAAPGEPTQLSVSLSKDSISKAMEGFVSSLNGLLETFGTLSSYDPATQESGVLFSDTTLRGIDSQLRRTLGANLGIEGPFQSLVTVGLGSQRDGSVALDQEDLMAALDNDFDAVVELLAAGAERLDGVVSGYIDSGGLLEARTEGISGRIENLGGQREALDLRLERVEQRYRVQFTALDALVGQMQATSDFLTQQLETLPLARKRDG